ncbi:MAG: response regulator [Desulfobulbaceae bacterium]|nr:response regulator [Desulfobulbaceae bacterium]
MQQEYGKKYRFGIQQKIAAGLVAFGILPILLGIFYLYLFVHETIEKKVMAHMISIADIKEKQIEDWLDNRLNVLRHLAADKDVAFVFNSPVKYQNQDAVQAKILILLQKQLSVVNEAHSSKAINLLDVTGRTIASSNASQVGTIDTKIVQRILSTKSFVIDDFYNRIDHERLMRFSAPVFLFNPDLERSYTIGGVISIEEDTANLQEIIGTWPGIETTGETLLVRREKDRIIFLNNLRHGKENENPFSIPTTSPLAKPAIFATDGDEGIMRALDYRGEPVLAAYRYIPFMDWGFVAKIDESEAFAPLVTMEKRIILFSVLLILAVLTAAFLFSRGITRALLRLEDLTRRVADGDYSIVFGVDRKDEIGSLAQSFATMMEQLKDKRRSLEEYSQTLEKKVEERTLDLLENIEKFKAVFEQAAVGVALLEKNTNRCIGTNRKFCTITGYTSDEMNSLSLMQIIHTDDHALIAENMEDLLTGKEKEFSIECRFLDSNGSILWIQLTVSSMWAASPNSPAHIAVLDNITAKKDADTEKTRMETQLRQLQKMEAIGTLAGGIAHDFNNILVPIISLAEILLAGEPQGSQKHEDLEEILTAAKRARDLVKQILHFSREREQGLEPLLIAPIIKESVKLLSSSLPSNIAIQLNISDEPVSVLADAVQVHQVVMNLCTNAYHAMRENGGTLAISLLPKTTSDLPTDLLLPYESYIELIVRDTGKGMDRLTQERIFEPYFTTKEKEGGTGLGLAVIHGIVRDYRGRIQVESEPDKGTAFHVFLPTYSKRTSKIPLPQDEVRICPTGKEHILIVDDEEVIAESMKRRLAKLGYTITVRTSSIEALELFRHKPEAFDLIITDQTMPNMTGDRMAIEMLRIRDNVPIIMCTGFSSVIDENKARKIGIKAFLLKPVVKEEMAHAIRSVLGDA